MRIPIAGLLIALFFASVGTSAAQTDVTISGSTTVMPLAEATAEEFNLAQDEYHVSVSGGGTGAGITNVAEGRSDIAIASREVTGDEIARYGDTFQEFLVGYDGVAIAVSTEIYDAGVTGLTTEQARAIYNGEINNWNEVGGPDEEIFVVSREQGSGTRDTFDEAILGSRTAEAPGVDTVTLSSAESKTAITGSDNAIGYLGYSYVMSGDLRSIALDGVLPTVQTIRDGSYGLARELYYYTFGEPEPGAAAYITYVRSAEGQSIVEENGFIPLTEPGPSPEFLNETAAGEEAGEEQEAESQPGFGGAMALLGMASAALAVMRRR